MAPKGVALNKQAQPIIKLIILINMYTQIPNYVQEDVPSTHSGKYKFFLHSIIGSMFKESQSWKGSERASSPPPAQCRHC